MAAPNERTHPNAGAFPPGVGGPVLRALANAKIRSLRDLVRWRESDLAALHGVGPKGIRILKDALRELGLEFTTGAQGGVRGRK